MNPSDNQLIEKALIATRHAYAPYSKFYVGAALVSEKGNIYVGCNVENKSYGLTMCAERNAIFHGVAEEGPAFKIASIAVFETTGQAFPPCGACLQVIQEFALPTTTVIFEGKSGTEKRTLKELLPHAF